MTDTVNVKQEFIKQVRTVVPAVLLMSLVLGFFNASEWTVAAVVPKITATFSMALLGCILGLCALFIGLVTANQMRSLLAGWLAGLMIGVAAIAFMLVYYANPIT